MTSKNSSWNINRDKAVSETAGTQPFLLRPAGKDYFWGGSRLRDDFAKEIDTEPLAETWECSTHPEGLSYVVTGEFSGMSLSEVLSVHPEYLGTHPRTEKELPILIKFIDAKKDLSVQVHPDDEYAMEHEGGALGKTEMWYVLEAAREAKLVYGFYHDVDRELVRKSVQTGTIRKYLQEVPVKKGDVFYILSGQVHAIGAGVLIAEIQQSSNLTYRLYDYDRVDKNGQMRELHLDKALDVANLKGSAKPRQPMKVFHFYRGYATEMLCRCKYFQVERMRLNTERTREMAEIRSGANSFLVLLCTDGCGVFYWEGGNGLNFYRGDCIFVPADSVEIKIHGQAHFLKVGC